MQQRVFATVIPGMVLMFVFATSSVLPAQSAPPGQVSHRMASVPPSAADAVNSVQFSGDLVESVESRQPSIVATKGISGTNTFSLKLPTKPATVPPLVVDICTSQLNEAAVDLCEEKKALGTARMAAWSVVVALDGEYPAVPERIDAARKIALKLDDTTDLPTAENLVEKSRLAFDWAKKTNIRDSAAAASALAQVQTQLNDATSKGNAVRVTELTAAVATAQKTLAVLADQAPLLDAGTIAADRVIGALKSLRCSTTMLPNTSGDPNAKPQFGYGYRVLLPTFGKSCSGDAIQSFFHAGPGVFEAANQVKYLYNAQQSASQFSADLLTATFPGFQAVLAGTATAGSSQPASTTTGATGAIARVHSYTAAATTTSTATTDSVATAVAKIQNGGDFNLRFPVPLLYYNSGSYSISSGTHPNIGFNIDQFSGQSTITESTEYGVNVPWETYMQTKSLDSDANGNANAVLFVDLQPSAEVISPALASKIGLTGSRYFFLGQAAAGIQFSNSIGISFQYFYGPKQAFASTDTSTTSSMTNSRIQGFHLAISFSPQKKSKS